MIFFSPPSENHADSPLLQVWLSFPTCYSKLMAILTHNYYNSEKLSVLTLLQVQHSFYFRHATALL